MNKVYEITEHKIDKGGKIMKLTSNDVLKLREVIARNTWLITGIKKLSFGQDRILKNIIEELIEYENSLAGLKSDTIPINSISIKKYLDKCIRFWRKKLKNTKTKEDKLIAKCNIDTYQSVRVSLLGEILENQNVKISIFGESLPKKEE